MSRVRPLGIREQVTETLREGFRSGRWAGVLPGVRSLAKELQVSCGTLQAALKTLEAEGLIEGKGAGARRAVCRHAAIATEHRALRVGMLCEEPLREEYVLNQAILLDVSQKLEAAGHLPFFAEKSQRELHRSPQRILKMMTDAHADAWIVINAGRDVLETLSAELAVPFVAVGGPGAGLPIASTGSEMEHVTRECVRRLIQAGHERIVFAAPLRYRHPKPMSSMRGFLAELEAHGIRPGTFNTPDWDYTAAGFNALLVTLFSLTPPTALILEDTRQVAATYAFLAACRIPPERVAICLLCTDATLDWLMPRPATVEIDIDNQIRFITDWVETCAQGRPHRERILFPARLLLGDAFVPLKR